MTQTTKSTAKTSTRIAPRKAAAAVAAAKPTVVSKPRSAITAKRATTPLTVAAGVVRKFFVFVEGARPVSGPRLAAHTNAVLLFLRLPEVPAKKTAVLALMGVRAVKYHRDIGNLEEKDDCYVLTQQGYEFFKNRVDHGKVSGELSASFLKAIQKGGSYPDAQIKESHLSQVSMATN